MPNTLFDILKYAEIKREDFALIDEKEIIRIEKKLKVAQKLNPEISPDEVERALDALKNHPDQLKYFYTDELLYNLFHYIEFKENDFIPFYKREEELISYQTFFSKYLEEDLLEEFKMMVQDESFKDLVRWQKARNLFTISFRHDFHQFLLNRLILIRDTLETKPSSWELSNKISHATSKHFYALLGEEDDQECVKVIHEILKFYKLNSSYTKGRDFTDRILHAMYSYKPNDSALNSYITITSLSYAGSNQVGVIAFIVIFAVVLFSGYAYASWATSGSRKNKDRSDMGYSVDARNMKDRAQRVIQYIEAKNIGDFKKGQSGTIQENQCDNVLKQRFNKLYPMSSNPDIAPATDLKTGDNAYANNIQGSVLERLIWPIGKGIKNIKVYNGTGQQVLVFVYITTCVPDSDDGAHCLKNSVYNEVFIGAGETLEFDNDFDSLAFRTGSNLYRLAIKAGSKNPKVDYGFCPFAALDSVFYSHTFCTRDINAGLEGMLTLKKTGNAYSVAWKGPKEAIFHRNRNAFLKPGKAVSIRNTK